MVLGARVPKQLMTYVNTFRLGVVLSRCGWYKWTPLKHHGTYHTRVWKSESSKGTGLKIPQYRDVL